jgi:hypothetical protein
MVGYFGRKVYEGAELAMRAETTYLDSMVRAYCGINANALLDAPSGLTERNGT